ncbi:SprT-like domain-containing protein [Methylobacterium sp. WL19]|uniref:SprT-like domain-containing protein n=1 Tax=Methylobacterium sp. WL19 TaxID=2603896 RepID=UPI0011CA78C3|nr:SprT-like domain-containing protein [Methylobacterium sp. WL19]TXN25559.1 SprT family zinc-dependent metalloprotease [Methylobacterium sp. WL19]
MIDVLTDPTTRTYSGLTEAYDFFNERLFSAKLPPCLITMQRKSKAYGYFAGRRFSTRSGEEVTDEIALNPSHFAGRTTEETLSTLVHEMVHLEQHHFGTPSRPGYHNSQWACLMKEVGLIPSVSEKPGGKETGQQVSHYIEPGGYFSVACSELINERGFVLPYVEIWEETERETRARKASSKTKYTCPECGVNAWAKPRTELDCGSCHLSMQAAGTTERESS